MDVGFAIKTLEQHLVKEKKEHLSFMKIDNWEWSEYQRL